MKFKSTRFGEIEFKEDEVIKTTKGILGFPHLTQYVVIQQEEGSHFRWLQSIEDPTVAFVVANPLDFFSQYRIKVNPSELEDLKCKKLENLVVLSIITVPKGNPAEMSANLLGPILVNPFEKLAKQVVLTNSPYTTKHYIIEELNKKLKEEEEKVQSEVAAVS